MGLYLSHRHTLRVGLLWLEDTEHSHAAGACSQVETIADMATATRRVLRRLSVTSTSSRLRANDYQNSTTPALDQAAVTIWEQALMLGFYEMGTSAWERMS